MTQKYIALPFPDYQEYMEEEWFREETYYDCNKDVYLIPIDRVQESDVHKIEEETIKEAFLRAHSILCV